MDLLTGFKELRFGYFLEDLSQILHALRETPELIEEPDLINLKVNEGTTRSLKIYLGEASTQAEDFVA
jgi:hypothetical protein